MSALLAAQRGQAKAESLMLDACTIAHRIPDSTDANGVVTNYGAAYYTGKCQVQTRTGAGQGTDIGEAYLIVAQRIVRLPMSVLDVVEGDRITITAAALDAGLVGNVYTARDIEEKSFQTARRVTCIEVLS